MYSIKQLSLHVYIYIYLLKRFPSCFFGARVAGKGEALLEKLEISLHGDHREVQGLSCQELELNSSPCTGEGLLHVRCFKVGLGSELKRIESINRNDQHGISGRV